MDSLVGERRITYDARGLAEPHAEAPRVAEIDGMLAGRDWLSEKYSVLDPYGFVFYTWGVRRELPMGEMKNYTAFKDRMLQRPAVQRVVADEKIKA